jgi:hypothetical protein
MSLARLQQDFLDAILAQEEPADPRLALYHRGARGAWRGALEASYPVVRRLVGEAWFGEAAARFGAAHPSRSGDLHVYGEAFAPFLAGYRHAQALPCLADVARLEWAVHRCRHAADDAPFDYAALGRLAADALPEVRIRLRDCVGLVESAHPILAIWEANQPGRDGTPARAEGPDQVVVRRVGPEVVPVAVSPGEWVLLESFQRGETLAEAAAHCLRGGVPLDEALGRMAALQALGRLEAR